MRDYKKEFTFRGVSISDELYNSFPCPIYTRDISDEDMQRMAEDIFYDTASHYRPYSPKANEEFNSIGEFTEHLLSIDEVTAREEGYGEDWEATDIYFWESVENNALDRGAVYYEDMSDEEYLIAIAK